MSHHAHHAMPDADMQRCIDACLDCHARCIETAAHCLDMGGLHASRAQHVMLLDCADACLAAAHRMLRGSPRHAATCALCAETCRACERACQEIAHGDAIMVRCAEACRRCADICERMASAAA